MAREALGLILLVSATENRRIRLFVEYFTHQHGKRMFYLSAICARFHFAQNLKREIVMFFTPQPVVVAIDLDDTIAHLNGPFATWHNERFGTAVRYEDIISFNLIEVYEIVFPTLVQRLNTFRREHWRLMLPVEEGLATLLYWKEMAQLHVVTARCESLADYSAALIDHFYPGVITEIHHTNGFATLYPERQKSKFAVCQKIGACMMIDDSLSTALEFAGSDIPYLLPNHPWNQGAVPQGAVRIHGGLVEAVDWFVANID